MTRSVDAAEVAITWRRDWTPHLFSFGCDRPDGLDFAPGQFVRLGVARGDGAVEWRAYSIASAPAAPSLEFYSIVVPDGAFTQALATRRVGDTLLVDRTVYGFLRTDRFAPAPQLWLLATGTGIAPFVSMLEDERVWAAFEDIVVVHSARTANEHVYRDRIEAAARPATGRARLRFVPVVTGSANGGSWCQRITALLSNRRLEGAFDLPIGPDTARLMAAGNPSMIKDVRAILVGRGLSPVRRDKPGHFIVENFW